MKLAIYVPTEFTELFQAGSNSSYLILVLAVVLVPPE